jgi:hypothetical protein
VPLSVHRRTAALASDCRSRHGYLFESVFGTRSGAVLEFLGHRVGEWSPPSVLRVLAAVARVPALAAERVGDPGTPVLGGTVIRIGALSAIVGNYGVRP